TATQPLCHDHAAISGSHVVTSLFVTATSILIFTLELILKVKLYKRDGYGSIPQTIWVGRGETVHFLAAMLNSCYEYHSIYLKFTS
ncbi:hypothetical protein, partial [Solemya velum gill symbiont]|uniref:hypothetical protein n=1 Tax=Solemya velum gill symbiont TaxID=2340 RepID=UPI001C4E2D6D